jgi:hypothetical protein
MKSVNFWVYCVVCMNWKLIKSHFKLKDLHVKRNCDDVIYSCCAPRDKEGFARISSALNEDSLKVNIHSCHARNLDFFFSFFCCNFMNIVIYIHNQIVLDGRVEISDELKDLYTIYQQEIHASVYTSLPRTQQNRMVYDTKLPPIYNRS